MSLSEEKGETMLGSGAKVSRAQCGTWPSPAPLALRLTCRRVATIMAVVVLPRPIWQLKTRDACAGASSTYLVKVSKSTSLGLRSSVTGIRKYLTSYPRALKSS